MLLLLAIAAAFADEGLALDAGTLVSPLMRGFSRLDREGSEEPRARWAVPPTGAGAEGFPDPLAADWLAGGTLHLDLPPGTWWLAVMQGRDTEAPTEWAGGEGFGLRVDGYDDLDTLPSTWADFRSSAAYAAAPRPVFLAGESAWDRQIAPAHPWRLRSIVVGGDGVDLEVVGRPLQALVAVPAAARAELEVFLTVTDDLRRGEYLRAYDPSGEGWVAPVVDRARVGPVSVGPEEARDALAWDVAPGEAVAATVWLPEGGSWRVEGLEDLAVEGFEDLWLDAAGHAGRERRPRPTFLVPSEGRLEGGQGVPVGLTLRVRVGPDAAPGTRRGRLVVDGRRVLPITVRVRAVRLPPAPVATGFFLQIDQAATLRDGFGSPAALDLLEQDLVWMRSLGMTAVSVRYALWPEASAAPDRPVDPTVIRAAMDRWAALGGTHLMWNDPKVPIRRFAYERETGPVLPGPWQAPLAAMLAEAQHPELALSTYLYDEEGMRSRASVARGRLLAERVGTLAPGLTRVAAVGHPVDRGVAGSFDVVLLGMAPPLSAAGVAAVRAERSEVWAYNLLPGASGPLQAWAAGVPVHLQWHWNPASSDPFDDVHRQVRWFHAVHAPDGSTWITPWALDMAEGLALTRWLAALEESDRPDDRALVAAVRGALDGATGAPSLDDAGIDAEALRALRRALAKAVERLQR